MRDRLLLLTASVLPVAVSFALTPLVTSAVSPSEYGQYVNYLTLYAVFNVLVGVASAGFVSNAYIQPEAAGRIAASMGCLALATALPCVLLAAVGTRLARIPEASTALILVAAAVLSYAVTAFQALMILRRQYGELLVVAAAQAIGQAGLLVALLATRRLDLWGLLLAHLAGWALAGAAVVSLWRKLDLALERPDGATLRRVVVYGLPLVPHLFLSLASGSFDRWYLLGYATPEVLAVYGVALTVAGAVPILLDVVNKVYSPAVFDRLKGAERHPAAFVRGVASFVVVALVIGLAVACTGFWFVRLAFDARYASAAWLCAYLSLASCAFALFYAGAPFLYYFNRTHLVLAASAAGAAATVLVSLALVGVLDVHALIVGKLAGYVVSGVVALAFAAGVLKRQRLVPAEVA